MAATPLDERLRNCFLVLLGVSTLPLSLLVVFFTSIVGKLVPTPSFRSHCQKECSFQPRTILVTGIGMAKGLTLARAFYQCGHKVIGADFETSRLRSSGRVSTACTKYYSLYSSVNSQTYAKQLVQLVKKERVDLWVSCSGVASALDDGRAQEAIRSLTNCCCIQFNTETTALLHDKSTFLRYTQQLGLPVPRTYHLSSTAQACHVLADLKAEGKQNEKAPEHRYILKPVGVDDANRGNMTLLPLSTRAETETYVGQFSITRKSPWILQQYIPGGQEYCTHALVVAGEVKVFVACPSAELLMHYEALPPSDPLSCAMLDFTRKFACRCNDEYGTFTGHLSFDFMVDTCAAQDGFEAKLYAIECNPRAHTAVVLFAQEGSEMQKMVQAYTSAIDHGTVARDFFNDTSVLNRTDLPMDQRAVPEDIVIPPSTALPRYWIGHDLVIFVLYPVLHLLTFRIGLDEFLEGIMAFLKHVCYWKEGTFCTWDPWPWVKLYHDYWPRAIAIALWEGRRWSRINVSTMKMFAC